MNLFRPSSARYVSGHVRKLNHSNEAFAYNASKAALDQLTVHVADVLKATNIKVNLAHPGIFRPRWFQRECLSTGKELRW